MIVHTVQKRQFYGIPFTSIRRVYNCYWLSDLLSVVSCAHILYCEYYGRISKNFPWIFNLEILRLLIINYRILNVMCLKYVRKV